MTYGRLSHGYDEGGLLPSGAEMAVNDTGRPMPVFTSEQHAEMGRRCAGDTYGDDRGDGER